MAVMKRKGAIELSVNFLVILVISLVVFGFGLSLFWKIYAQADEQMGQMSQSMEREIQSRLHSGDKVSIVPRQLDMSRNEDRIIGIGIRNIESDKTKFKIYAKRSLFYSPQNDISCSFTPGDGEEDCAAEYDIPQIGFLGLPNEIEIIPNEQGIRSIMLKTDRRAMSGEYVIDICVCKDMGGCIDFTTCTQNPYDINYPISKIRIRVV